MDRQSLRRTRVILNREYLQRIYSRSFVASTLLLPAIPAAIFLLSSWLMGPGVHGATVPARLPAPSHAQAMMAGAVLSAIILLYVLFGSLFTYGAIVMRAVLDEKQSRVLEVLLCFASPEELMTGKILGVGAVALTQVLVWVVLAVGVGVFSAAQHRIFAALGLGPAALAWFIMFEVLGYLLYSAIFCAIGAAFNSPDEAQQWMFVMVLPLVVTATLISVLVSRPDAPVMVIASIVPFTAPALMYARMLVGHPPYWQIALATGLLLASIGIAIRTCAGIYRVGILMYGRKPTLREIMRWTRYA